jgi:gliding motility-associated protein GldL
MSIPFHEKDGFKRLKNLIIGLGASVVLVGALFKIMHWPYANEMLLVGMLTEAFLFAMLGILPPHQDYYWEKIYPGLDKAPDHAMMKGLKPVTAANLNIGGSGSGGSSSTQALDKMLDNAKIGPELIENLGKNLRTLGDQVGKLSDISSTSVATSEFTKNANDASQALSKMSGAYSSAAGAMEKMNLAQGDTAKYHEQVQLVSKNLAQLNAMYELELQDTNSHLKAMNKFYGSLTNAMGSLEDSVKDTEKYKEEMGKLAKQLTSLNSIYGGMLNAMTIKG